jgi:hypothetical protein
LVKERERERKRKREKVQREAERGEQAERERERDHQTHVWRPPRDRSVEREEEQHAGSLGVKPQTYGGRLTVKKAICRH